MKREQCPWGYKFNKGGTSRTVNRKHRCNVSCWERWTLMRCLQWARETALRWGPGEGETKTTRRITHTELPAWERA